MRSVGRFWSPTELKSSERLWAPPRSYPEIKGALLEGRVLAMVKEVMLDPAKLRECMDFFREDAHATELRLEKEVRALNGRLEALYEQKRRIIDIYASGDLSRDGYVGNNCELDGAIET